MRSLVLLALGALGLSAALAAPASAARSLDVGIADDRLLFHKPEKAPALARQWAAMGIDVVRIHVRWVGVAPGATDRTPPRDFDASDPDDRHYTWGYLDRAVQAVTGAGLKPILAITGSGPLWATRTPSSGNARAYPLPSAFGRFAEAVARRFGAVTDSYVVWNEPNQPAWLQPQSACTSGARRCSPVAPHLYRELLRAAYAGIKEADRTADVLAGALAPSGREPVTRNRPLRPLAFLRAFGCVDRRLRPVRTGRCRGFRPARFDGFSHHPHGLLRGPDARALHRDDVAIADLGRLTRVLDRIQDTGGFRVPGDRRAPLHLTEFGYQTSPPDPYAGVTLGRQARWLQQSSYLAWRNPRVRTLVQYEFDDEPIARKTARGRSAYAGWQSGLRTSSGRPKPALASFVSPIWARRTPGSRKVELWGQARPGGRHVVVVERRLVGTSRWVRVARLRTDARGGWVLRRVVPRHADHRFFYARTPGGEIVRSRPLLVEASARRAPGRARRRG